MIVDAHTHLLPERMATAVREFFKTHIPGPLAYPIDHRQVLDCMATGSQRCGTCPTPTNRAWRQP